MKHNTKQETRTTHRQETETMTPGEGTKGSDICRAGNQGSDGVQVSDDTQVRVTMVTGVRHNEQPGDLEAGEGTHVTLSKDVCRQRKILKKIVHMSHVTTSQERHLKFL